MGKTHRFLKALSLLVLVCMAQGTGAQEDMMAQARELLKQRKGAAAYELLKPAAEANAGNPDFDLLYGMAAIDAGKPAEAAFALERVLDVQPDNAAAQAELGRAYYEMGEDDTARSQFERARGEKLAPAVEQNIDRYLSAIQARLSAKRTTYNAYVETGAGYDSNVNSATDREQIQVTLPLFGSVPVPLPASGVEQDSAIWTMNAGFNFSSPLDPLWRLYGGIDFFHRAALEDTVCATASGNTSCSTSGANGNLGVQYAPNDLDKWRLSAFGQKFYVGHDENRDLIGGNAEYVRTVTRRDQLNAFAQFGAFRFPGQEFRDVDRVVGGVGWGHAFAGRATPIMFASVYGGTELEHDDGEDLGIGRNLVGARFGGEYSLTSRARAFGSFLYQGSWYDSPTPFFVGDRQDDYLSVDAGVRYAITRLISVRPEVRYTINDSNVVITDFDRWEALVSFRSDF